MTRPPRPLRRQLFFWFAGAILVSTLMGFGVGWLLNRLRKHDVPDHPVEQFVAVQVATQWADPAKRARILTDAADHLTWGVVLRDPSGVELESHGLRCPQPFAVLPVQGEDGPALGELTFCPPRVGPAPGPAEPPSHQHPPPEPHAPRPRPLFGLFLFALLLGAMWAASGKVARLLAKPLQDLAKVADDLGHGHLTSRAALADRHHRVTELDTLARSINQMAERIERQMHDQKELLASVSHELRTPLGHAKLLMELIRDTGDVGKPLDELDRELAELERMVGQLLASARLDFTATVHQPLDPVQLAIRALERAGLDPTALQVDAAPEAIHGDAALLAQALANLLDNAKRHGAQLQTLRVSLTDNWVWFDALDTGPGFAPGEADTAFAPFHRGPASHGGLGLGLALVQRIVLAHKGQVRAFNRPEGGACVGIGLPVQAPAKP